MVFSQSDMLAKEVYLFARIDRNVVGESMKYLKCIVFLRPVAENLELLKAELKHPKYGQYHICKSIHLINIGCQLMTTPVFSNVISKTEIKSLAEADEHEVIRDVQEFYADYIGVSPHLFSLNMVGECYNGSSNNWNALGLQRSVQGIISVLLTLKKCPSIRYQASSEPCKRLAEGVRHVMSKEGSMFNFNSGQMKASDSNSPPPVLLIIDRRSDLITPLLNQVRNSAS